ncbi:MAG: alpha-amylase family glycosyl hydrolase, partial [Acidimicrobiales bacterium]
MPRKHQRDAPVLSPVDLHLFNEGRHFQLYDHFGAHILDGGGTSFAVWAPNAERVSVLCDKNGWKPRIDELEPQGSSGIWAGALPGLRSGSLYKYRIEPRVGRGRDKSDPVAFESECPPLTASVVSDLSYEWNDGGWMADRAKVQAESEPMSIYEVHLGSWQRKPDGSYYGYTELAERLADHIGRHGFTHVELLPVMEHPYYGSWGYQTSGFFAPTARYGSPRDFMAFVDHLHQCGIGVILDWVPSHFATDEFALGEFDGTHLYEHSDPRHMKHPDWGSYEFN